MMRYVGLICVCLLLSILDVAASELASHEAEQLKQALMQRMKTERDIPVLFQIGSGVPTPGRLQAATAIEFKVIVGESMISLSASSLSDASVYAMFSPSAHTAGVPESVAWLTLGTRLGKRSDQDFRQVLAALRLIDANAVAAIDGLAGQNFPAKTHVIATNSESKIVEPTKDASHGGTISKPSRSAYGSLSHPAGVAGMDARLGPHAQRLSRTGAVEPQTDATLLPVIPETLVPLAPIMKSPYGAKTSYNFGTPSTDSGSYWTTQGQVLYVPDKPNDAGVDRIHIGCYGNHTLQFVPIPAWWGGSHPEPGVMQKSWKDLAGGSLGMPFFIERAYSSFSENGFMIFTSGLIGAGSVNNVPKYPCFRFPENKWPVVLSVTNRNEFLLVAVWDSRQQKAQLAVLALGLTENGKTGFCLPNWGIHNVVKLLGYVDLPGLELPSAIASTAAGDPWAAGPNEAYNYDYSTAANRAFTFADPAIARSGYCVITSRIGNSAAFVDLQPLFEGVRRNCFTTQELADKARNFGLDDGQWPYTFSHEPLMKPVFIANIPVPAPTAVRTSMREAHGRPAITAIACEKGEVRVFRVGGLLTEARASEADIQPHCTIQVGANPCSMAYQRIGDPLRPSQGEGVGSWDAINYTFLVCCRGDKEIDWIEISPTGGTCYRRMRDKRLVDPVHVQQMRINSDNAAYIFTVSDFQGRKIVNYRVGPAHLDDKNIPIESGAEVECTGWLDLPGFPFMVSADNVP